MNEKSRGLGMRTPENSARTSEGVFGIMHNGVGPINVTFWEKAKGRGKRRIIPLVVCAVVMMVSCNKKPFASSEPEPPPAFTEIFDAADNEEIFNEETLIEELLNETNEDDEKPMRIIVPYTKEYLSPGQETRITVYLENGGYGDEIYFEFTEEPGKNNIKAEGLNNTALVRAIGEGEQYLRISHPKAQESRIIVYDVLPPSPPPPPEIDVSESPMIIRKDETKPLQMILLNGSSHDRDKFRFQVVENAYAIEVKQYGSILHVPGIAPGAGKIRISNPSALRDYDVMVIVD
jgi:hypothetical protein